MSYYSSTDAHKHYLELLRKDLEKEEQMKVICIKNQSGNCKFRLTIGKEYNVEKETPVGYTIINDQNYPISYRKGFFKPVIEKKNSLLRVQCIDATGCSLISLGKEYNVERESEGFYFITDNENKSNQGYSKFRFTVVKENETMDTMKVTLPTGLVIEGTYDQLREALTSMGKAYLIPANPHDPTVYYNSSSKGWVKIKEMATPHLRNAILKRYAEWVEELRSLTNPRVLCNAMKNGISDLTWLAMVREYSTRPEDI